MEALFLEGAQGPLFAVHHAAEPQVCQGLGLVYLPPFAEEMNRSRRMATRQARRLAALGVDVLLLDPFGTGDSAGDFGEARWEAWRADVGTAQQWLGVRCGGRVGLWGLRLGALLAADVAARAPERVARLLLWQPVLSGERYLTQFLRLRVAAGMAGETGRETTKELRARLSQGEGLEIGGYELAPSLAEAIDVLKLAPLLERLGDMNVGWLEVSSAEVPGLLPTSQQVLDGHSHGDGALQAEAVGGEPFWTIQEFTLAPELLQATDKLFQP